ncbi:hypothetical protein [Defluviimonas sp. WL0075]|uniref:Uncharacterized protein n=1 Tax=Albidovulum sediminicola TaxID=2984331 RepID=A0ABT2Z1X2_9RHOB|nr:hypothetical protein [Defluviimonas sp. WL0075]MCV2865148.1 hypothetical protein [Defluviimonas sp. WL0075]
MKPGFALSLSDERIDLLARTPEGWAHLGAADPASGDLPTQMAALRAIAGARAPEGVQTKLILPASQVLYAEIAAPGPDDASRRAQIAAALEGCTPYRVEELVFDWSGKGPLLKVAVVARMTLDEAEGFAEEFDFAPLSFVTVPGEDQFAGEPFFGATKRQASHMPKGARLDRDREPMRFGAPPLGVPAVDVPAVDGSAQPAAEETAPATADTASPDDDTASAPPLPATEMVAEGASDAKAVEPDSADREKPQGDEAPFAEIPDDGDIFPVGDDDWIATEPTTSEPVEPDGASELKDSAESLPKGVDPVPGFTSHRSAGVAGADGSRIENIASRIQMAAAGTAPRATRAVPGPARPLQPPAPMRAPAPALSREDAIAAGSTLTRGLDRVRAPAGMAELETRQRQARRRMRHATAVAAALFVAIVGLWWWYFETQPVQPTASAPVASAPEAPTEDLATQQPAEPGPPPASEAQAADEPPAQVPASEAPTAQDPASAALEPLPAKPGELAPQPPVLSPVLASKPTPDAAEGRPAAGSERAVTAPAAAALDQAATEGQDPAPAAQPLPTAFESLRRFDSAGNVIPTAEGVRMAEGFTLYAGRPNNAPPQRPEAIEALAAALAPTLPDAASLSDAAPAPETPATTDPASPEADAGPQPAELTSATKRPVARPASIVPPAEPGAPSAAPVTEQGTEAASPEDEATAAPEPDPRTAGTRPVGRPAAIEAAAAEAATEPVQSDAVQTASRYAVATSPRPSARPEKLTRGVDNSAVEAALAAALADASAAVETAPNVAPDEIDEPEPESAAPDIPTKANVAKQATIANAINLGELSLIGIFGPASKRHALVRTSKGKILNVAIGDKLDGGKVSAIGDGQLSYTKGGKTYVLKMTDKS